MLSIVFNLKYLSKNFIKFNIQGVFWNPQDEQISKLTLVIKFDQDLMEKKRKTSWLILTDTGCISSLKLFYCQVSMKLNYLE